MYTAFDLASVNSSNGYIELPKTSPISSSLVEGGRVPFQFMPRIGNDKNKADFNVTTIPNTTNPIPLFMGGHPRTISLSTDYIVDGGTWSIKKIKNILSALRGYYTDARLVAPTLASSSSLVCKVKLWSVGGDSPVTCRIESIDIKHSGGWVSGFKRNAGGGADGAVALDKPPGFMEDEEVRNQYYADQQTSIDYEATRKSSLFPLKTEVSMVLVLWVNNGEGSNGVDFPADIGLDAKLPIEWY